ncbi:transposase [Variovorax saccharolyticus]|uniref:transposase n=1 Tax=Variovorax saccharolyticus TaxID=3053516 RepID=UPI002577AA42|nr:transposase [Variovorax sp. J31P216]MDM0030485.1 transposase [Variovorax sp. J31P216]
MNDHVTSCMRRWREHWLQQKGELVSRSLEAGASVAAVALEAGVNSSLLFAWRRMHRDAQAPELNAALGPAPILLPVTVESPRVQDACAPPP